MSIRDSIKTILLSGGDVSYSYKTKYLEWFTEGQILSLSCFEKPAFWANGIIGLDFKSENVDEVIDIFCKFIFTPKNLSLVVKGAKKHGLGEIEFSKLERDPKLKSSFDAICKRYENEFFALDYPEFTKEKQ